MWSRNGRWFAIVFLLALSAAAAEKPRSIFPTIEQINVASLVPDWGGLHPACEADLKLKSQPIVDFSPPPHYLSTGPRPERKDAPEASLGRESMAIYRLAICFQISKDTRFSAKAEELLDGWAKTTKRVGTEQGEDGFNFSFPYALMGAYLLKQDPTWNLEALNNFVRTIVVPTSHASHENNHAEWGVLLLVTAGGYLDDQVMVDHARQRWIELMKSQIAADGSMPLEICRSNTTDWCGGPTKGIRGIAYTHFTLHPATIAAEVFRNLGEDVYATPGGDQLRKAYIKAAAWTLHPETFPYYAANNGKLEDIHNTDYFYILQQRFPIPDGSTVLQQDNSGGKGGLYIKLFYSSNSATHKP